MNWEFILTGCCPYDRTAAIKGELRNDRIQIVSGQLREPACCREASASFRQITTRRQEALFDRCTCTVSECRRRGGMCVGRGLGVMSTCRVLGRVGRARFKADERVVHFFIAEEVDALVFGAPCRKCCSRISHVDARGLCCHISPMIRVRGVSGQRFIGRTPALWIGSTPGKRLGRLTFLATGCWIHHTHRNLASPFPIRSLRLRYFHFCPLACVRTGKMREGKGGRKRKRKTNALCIMIVGKSGKNGCQNALVDLGWARLFYNKGWCHGDVTWDGVG